MRTDVITLRDKASHTQLLAVRNLSASRVPVFGLGWKNLVANRRASTSVSTCTDRVRTWAAAHEQSCGSANKKVLFHKQSPLVNRLPNKGSSGNPMHTGSSHDILVLATAHLQRGGDQFRQHFAVTHH